MTLCDLAWLQSTLSTKVDRTKSIMEGAIDVNKADDAVAKGNHRQWKLMTLEAVPRVYVKLHCLECRNVDFIVRLA